MQKARISQGKPFAYIEVSKGNSEECYNTCLRTEKAFNHILKATVAHHQKTVAVFYVNVKPEVYAADLRVKLAAETQCKGYQLGRSYLNEEKTMYVQELADFNFSISTLVSSKLHEPSVMFFYKNSEGKTIGKDTFKELIEHLLEHTLFNAIRYPDLEKSIPELKKIFTTESFMRALQNNIDNNE